MIFTAMFDEPEEIINAMYKVTEDWIEDKPDQGLLLPDTYGTSFFLNNCPESIIQKHI
jgi:hypothetical protein